MTQDTEAAKNVVDALSVGTVVATLAGMLPSIAAIFTICWTVIRIYETETVKKLLGKKLPEAGKD
jgi:chromate transport protein ChrA